MPDEKLEPKYEEEHEPPQLAAGSLDPEDPEYSLLMPDKRLALDAIKTSLRTTAPELATSSGLSINSATYWLNKIAGETGAKLEVANDGTVYYSFAPNFSGVYRRRGRRRAALLAGAFLFKSLYWVVRVSFGVALMTSVLVIVLIFVALILLAIASIFDGGGGDSGDFGSFDGSGFFDTNFLSDIFSWDYSPSHSSYQNSIPSAQRDRYTDFIEKHPKGNFFLECFSFLFGDGKPNSNLQKLRWQQIATTIKANGGVVSAEQLAPFLDGDTSDSGMVMSALAQFNGHPEVTKSGFIVYVFPDYISEHPLVQQQPQNKKEQESYLKEENWKFSNFPPINLANVLMLAIFNFCGSWWLFKHIATINLLHHLAALIDVLLTYSIILLVIPAVRFLILLVLNQRIDSRNEKRKAAAELVKQPQGEILKELEEAKAIQSEHAQLLRVDSKIIFDSGKDSLEQKFENTD
ncbi:MAG: hypothetical protein QG574_769 [Cyanobacteriota bacterium erpe_2018_sw_21hr_WHONDRS-SW48-000092_B_bin.40]|nr:hypothetical protein [Cyanobacteriota bacterium erpe_2018_sw_21hr_WHONDRS-SW48-000092_B_bin.40]